MANSEENSVPGREETLNERSAKMFGQTLDYLDLKDASLTIGAGELSPDDVNYIEESLRVKIDVTKEISNSPKNILTSVSKKLRKFIHNSLERIRNFLINLVRFLNIFKKEYLFGWILTVYLFCSADALFYVGNYNVELVQILFDTPRASVVSGVNHYKRNNTSGQTIYVYDSYIEPMVNAEKAARLLDKEYGLKELWKYSEYRGVNYSAVSIIIPDGFDISEIKAFLEKELKIPIRVERISKYQSGGVRVYAVILEDYRGSSKFHWKFPMDLPPDKGSPNLL